MPGFLESSIHQSYGYLEQTGYVDKARPYVEKVLNTVPLADRAVKKAEEIVPPLITKADELAEPTIVKMRPYVEPRIEQVKETVTPYVNKGVEKYEQIKDYTETKTTQIKDFTDRQVTHVKDFKDAKTTQIKKLTDPPVQKLKTVVEPHFNARKIQAQKLLRVTGCADLQVLNCESVLGKVASGLSKAEIILDKYLPVPIERRDSDSDSSTESDSSYTKINKSVHAIKNHLLCAIMLKIRLILSLPLLLKTSYADGSMQKKVMSFYSDTKGTVVSKVEFVKGQVKSFVKDPKSLLLKMKIEVKSGAESVIGHFKEKLAAVPVKLAPAVTKIRKNPHFVKAVQVAVTTTEKILGKEKTATIVKKIESCIPAAPTPKPASYTKPKPASDSKRK
jgi:hypothetical protein